MVFGLALVEVLSLLSVCFYLETSILPSAYPIALALVPAAAMAFCCLISFYYNDLYDFRVVRRYTDFIPRLIRSLLAVLIMLAIFYMVVPRTGIDEGLVLKLLVVAAVIVLIRAVFYFFLTKGLLSQRVLILGRGPLAYRIAEEIERAPHLRYSTLGLVDDGPEAGGVVHERTPSGGPFRTLGHLDQLSEIIDSLRPHRIVVALSERRGRLPVWRLLESSVNGVRVEDGIDVYERLTGKVALESLAPSSIVFSEYFRKSRWRLAMIRVLNVLASFVGIILLAPLFTLIAIFIKLDSAGPVFFIQPRLGLRNRSFGLIKFRTMHSRRVKTSEWVEDNKSRFTRLGPSLRKYRLDELPQLFNVLWGDMNLIGPRPHPVSNHELFLENIAYYPLRAVVRPGITGWAQVRYGYANNLEEEREKMRYDLHYVKHMSFWMDFRILLDTVKCVLFGTETVQRAREQAHGLGELPPLPPNVRTIAVDPSWHPRPPRAYPSHFRERHIDASSNRTATKPATLL